MKDYFVGFCVGILPWLVVLAVAGMTPNSATPDALPTCQEDEYLYPVDCEGPGENEPGDYRCIHADTITEENAPR